MQTNAKLHPKLQIAVDRLNKRYANVVVKKYNTKDCNLGEVDSQGNKVFTDTITELSLYTEVWDTAFARIWVENTGDDINDHKFVIESRLIRNERSPKDEKRTIKEKLIPKLVDEYARPFTYDDRARGILECGHRSLYRPEYDADQKKSEAWRDITGNDGVDMILNLIEGKINPVPQELIAKANAYREARDHYRWIKSNRHVGKNAAVQVIAFNVGERWILNVYGADPSASKTEEYNSFDDLPDIIKEKVALLRIAPHNEMLDEIGVKVEANSYFLYGKELQIYKKPNDSGEESKDEGNKTA